MGCSNACIPAGLFRLAGAVSKVRELSVDELEAAASAALAMLQMRYPTLIEETDEALIGAYKVGFADGARYICDVLSGDK